MVVQSSYYKNIEVDLPGLYVSMADAAGFNAKIVCRMPVGRSLAQINSRSSRHVPAKIYSEAVVCLERA